MFASRKQPIEDSRLSRSIHKRDKYDAIISPGDVCILSTNSDIILGIYVRPSPGGRTGQYGLFYTIDGKTSVKYKNVVVAYDSMGIRVINHDITKQLMRRYYG